ncbi:hypothetical protein K7X08_029966 [Anisodus acutangulus]|uniref:Uncharacterized protein n=1 Tax=Anisodus acutangulus TaxID=402998 RepID=A0A9Q1LNB6_9SOLA|nr:hypothetical protein K7X08_029966 [Anisodus acutangulus]
MDAAIDDGVDILSISLGGSSKAFHNDPIALGAYSATQRVGASTLDRKLKATIKLGNNKQFEGESAFNPKGHNSTFSPLFDPALSPTDVDSPYCGRGTLNDPDIKNKIVLCMAGGGYSRIGKGQAVKDAGGVGMIIYNGPDVGVTKSADAHVLPALVITYQDGMNILAYMNSTSKPVARISFQGTIIGDKDAPVVASFSSRRPSLASPGILKPDIIGPGVNILAAYPTFAHKGYTFNILLGTSMSCPHLSGVAALLKSAHPTWSPAAIKSAIMTTANTVNLANNPILDERLLPASIFAVGAGHVNPSRANDPGLVYDTQSEDYLPYLCGLNYTNGQVRNLLQRRVDCKQVKSIPEAQLNYPSFSIRLGTHVQTYTRTVTNVGDAKSSYNV